MKITRFEDIEAWKAARRLSRAISGVTRNQNRFPDLALVRQLQRCAGSIMANIVEGFDSGTDREFFRFLKIAYRSASELQSHLYVALDERYMDQKSFDSLYSQAHETKGRIGGFMRYLREHPRSPTFKFRGPTAGPEDSES
jgi:four helix bundle protein